MCAVGQQATREAGAVVLCHFRGEVACQQVGGVEARVGGGNGGLFLRG